MTTMEFIEVFDTMAEAPGGIDRLRELVLQLAVQGKLVPQDPNDEPASKLLKRIAAAKARTSRKGRVKVRKVVDPALTRLNYHLPSGWASAHLSDLAQVLNGRAYKKSELLLEGMPVLRVGNLFTSNQWYYSDLDLDEDKYCEEGDLIYAWSASFGPFIWRGPKVIYHYHIWKLSLFSETDLRKQFLYNVLLQKTQDIKNAGHGISMVHLTKKKMEQLIVPLPPLAEQHRIVAKINELMGLIDRLENSRCSQEVVRTAARDSALAALRNAATPAEVESAWTRIAEQVEDLFTTPDDLTPLREAVLQLAVQGRLVPQDSNDEPASQLLKHIAKEKARLERDKKIKNLKSLPTIQDEELPFEIPLNWKWTHLGEITSYGSTGKVSPGEVDEATWVLELEDIEKVSSRLLNRVHYGMRPFKSTKNCFYKGDVLYGKLRPYLDKVILADEDGVCTSEIMPIRGFVGLAPEFIRLVLKSPYFVQYANSSTHGMNLPRLGTDKARQALFPLPPEAEQYRISTKVDELMRLIDRLEQHLIPKGKHHEAFAAATVNQCEGIK